MGAIQNIWKLEYVNSQNKVELTSNGSEKDMRQQMEDTKQVPPGCKLVLKDDTGKVVQVYDR
jgi:hypothetical protein